MTAPLNSCIWKQPQCPLRGTQKEGTAINRLLSWSWRDTCNPGRPVLHSQLLLPQTNGEHHRQMDGSQHRCSKLRTLDWRRAGSFIRRASGEAWGQKAGRWVSRTEEKWGREKWKNSYEMYVRIENHRITLYESAVCCVHTLQYSWWKFFCFIF